MYQDVLLHIGGKWRAAASGRTIDIINPATEEVLGRLAHASTADLDEAVQAAAAGFAVWRKVSAYERSKIMRKAADLVRERSESIARLMTQEKGKPGERGFKILCKAFEAGLMVRAAGDSIVLAPPFAATAEEISQMTDIMRKVIIEN